MEPEFCNAKEHDPNKMTLLCPQCHAKVTKGLISKDTVKRAMKNPKCKEVGFSCEVFYTTTQNPEIRYGRSGLSVKNVSIPIQINSTPLLKIEKPKKAGEPYSLSCIFYDSKNRKSLEIIDNECFIFNHNWDVVTEGKSIIIREKQGVIHLKLTFDSPRLIIIEKLNMNYFGNKLIVDNNGFKLNGSSFDNCLFENGHIGIKINCVLKRIPMSIVCSILLSQ